MPALFLLLHTSWYQPFLYDELTFSKISLFDYDDRENRHCYQWLPRHRSDILVLVVVGLELEK